MNEESKKEYIPNSTYREDGKVNWIQKVLVPIYAAFYLQSSFIHSFKKSLIAYYVQGTVLGHVDGA